LLFDDTATDRTQSLCPLNPPNNSPFCTSQIRRFLEPVTTCQPSLKNATADIARIVQDDADCVVYARSSSHTKFY
jgi:hypothetical protein